MAALCRLRILSGLQNFARIQHFRSIASRSASFSVLKKQTKISPVSHVQIVDLQHRFSEINIPVRNYASLPDVTLKDIEDRCVLVLRLFDKVDPEKVTMDARFKEDLGLDSLDAVEIIMAMEDEFGVEIPDETAERLLHLKDVVECLADRLDVAH